MTVDWFTVGAQVLNFLVLVYLLRRFLYGPIVRAMARREEEIADRLRQAREQREEAEAEAQRHRQALEELEVKRERLLARAREEADDLGRRREKDLRQEMDELRERWRDELAREQAAFLRDVRRQAAEQFEALARSALADLASADLEAQMARVLIARLGDLDDERREVLEQASASGEPVRVRSAFELSAAVKRSVTSAIHGALGREVDVAYERAAEVVCGVEIRAGGQNVAWSIESHLDALARRLAEGLGEGAARKQGDGTPH